MGTLLHDVRFGFRMLARAPVVSTVAALSLALGIAANASIFSVLDAFVFSPLPYAEQDRLVILREGPTDAGIELLGGTAVGNFLDIEEGVTSFAAASFYHIAPANLTNLEVPEQVHLVTATPDLFRTLGVQPALGRDFRPEEGVEGAGDVLLLEHDFWQSRFLADPTVLGRALELDGRVYTVIGVMPETFDLIPADVHAIRPSDFAAARDDRTTRAAIAFARLTPGATVEGAGEELAAVYRRLEATHPEANRGYTARLLPAREFFPGPTDTKLVMILTAVTLFGLLIACANVANLLLGRAEERQREVAVRTALGAGRGRIVRQLLTESGTLGLVAGAVGLGLSVLVVRWLAGIMPPVLPQAMVPRLDLGVLLATIAVSVGAGIAFGLAPALTAIRGGLRDAMGEGARGGTGGRGGEGFGTPSSSASSPSRSRCSPARGSWSRRSSSSPPPIRASDRRDCSPSRCSRRRICMPTTSPSCPTRTSCSHLWTACRALRVWPRWRACRGAAGIPPCATRSRAGPPLPTPSFRARASRR